MKKMNDWMLKCASILAAVALMITTVANGSTCWFTAYQPEEPDMDEM